MSNEIRMDKFRRSIKSNTTVATLWQCWFHGGFDSLEECLMEMVVSLAEQNRSLVGDVIQKESLICEASIAKEPSNARR